MVVLHGDLHHENVLSSNDGWVCIDAKGVLGEPAWEIGPYLYNSLPDPGGEAETPCSPASSCSRVASPSRKEAGRVLRKCAILAR